MCVILSLSCANLVASSYRFSRAVSASWRRLRTCYQTAPCYWRVSICRTLLPAPVRRRGRPSESPLHRLPAGRPPPPPAAGTTPLPPPPPPPPRCRPFDGAMHTQFNSVSRIDRISRGLFPSVFLLLNLIYWYSYLSHSERITLVSGT